MAENAQGSENAFQFRRAPARPRRIADIDPERDMRVRILGRVTDRSQGSITISDGSASAEIILDEVQLPESDFIRVFCRVLPLEDGYELRAELAQDAKILDTDLYKKIHGKN